MTVLETGAGVTSVRRAADPRPFHFHSVIGCQCVTVCKLRDERTIEVVTSALGIDSDRDG